MDYASKTTPLHKPYQIIFHEGSHAIDNLASVVANNRWGNYSSEYKKGALVKAIDKDLKILLDNKKVILQNELESKVICDDCGMSTGYLPGLASLARWRDLVETKCFQVENEASE